MGIERQIRLEPDGSGQVVRIPADLALPGRDALISKVGDQIIIRPARDRTQGLLEWLAQQEPWPDDEEFPDMDLRDPPPEDVKL